MLKFGDSDAYAWNGASSLCDYQSTRSQQWCWQGYQQDEEVTVTLENAVTSHKHTG